jgi:hypothetical protein
MRASRLTDALTTGLFAAAFLVGIHAQAQTTISNIDDSSAWFHSGTSTPNFIGNANLSWMT